MRVGDAEREAAAAEVREHFASGRLTQDELNQRLDQTFAAKTPKLVILGVTEKPSRFGHEAFKYVADPGAVANPGYLGDLNYFSDLIYLPFRQLRLFAADILPGGLGMAKTFEGLRGPQHPWPSPPSK